MDNGRIVEFATPYELLQNTKGIFRKMVYMLGLDEIKQLNTLAKDKFIAKSQR